MIGKSPLVALMASLLGATLAVAADFGPVSDAPAETVRDWSGLFLGGAVSYVTGHDDWAADGRFDLDTSYVGAGFIGYNLQRGHLVAGLELSGTLGRVKEENYPWLWYDELFEIKGRLGYTIGDFLLYVSGGYTHVGLEEDGVGFSMNGYNIGGGYSYAWTDHIFIGTEASYHEAGGACPHDQDVEGKFTTITSRIGYRF